MTGSKYRNVVLVLVVALLGVGVYYASSKNTEPANLPEVEELATLTDSSFEEYSDYFRTLADNKGAEYAYQVLLYAPLAEGTDIHLLAHVVGDKLYEQQGMEGIYACTQDFRNACSHSVVIGILNEHGEGALSDIAETCRKAPGGLGAYTMCFHGLGHGVLAFNGYKFDKAVAMCEKTATEEFKGREHIECVGGATMEMVAGVHDRGVWEKEVKNYFKVSDPLFPCDASFMSKEIQPICYIHLTPHFFQTAGMDLGNPDPSYYAKAFSFCDALPKDDTANRSACYGGFGKEFTVLAQGRDVRAVGVTKEPELRNVRTWCALAGTTDGERECNAYALASLFWGGENPMDASLLFCSIAEGELQVACYQQLADHTRYYFPNMKERRERCSKLPEEYQMTCGGR